MKILVINSGSSSIKYQLYDMNGPSWICKGLIERVGRSGGVFHYKRREGAGLDMDHDFPDHVSGINYLFSFLTDPEQGVIKDLEEIDAVGHRFVHGGESIKKAELVTAEIESVVEENSKLAPLHNPPTLLGYRACRALLPQVPMVGVFDTAFHSTMPESSYLYGIPFEYHRKHSIRRFGFHGASHKYVTSRAAEILNLPVEETNLVTCHIGNGVSLTAVRGGRSVDTSLGFGTMCGAPMGTRAGDIDPDIMLYLQESLGMSAAAVRELIYKKSGLLGMSGVTNDMRDLLNAAAEGNRDADLANQVFTHAIRRYVGALAVSLEGRMDALVFTAGIGENSPDTRERVCRGLEVLGIHLDREKNQVRGEETVLSKPDSPVKVLLIPTNEELMIARETADIVSRL
jgi:acetate kinase